MRIENDVLTVLSAAITEGNALKLVGALDRKLYERTNKVLDAAGGKWDKRAKAHLFPGDAAEAMEQIILTGEVDYAKSPKSVAQIYGFFPTPAPVVARLMELADVKPGMLALEPSAGTGAISKVLAAAGADVDGVEIQEVNCAALANDGHMRNLQPGDFLLKSPAPEYDRVVMNPPFAKQDDIRHVMHALKFVKPGGRLVAVMSAGVTFRDNRLTQEFRDAVRALGGSFEDVPEGAFKESGTMVRTVIADIPVPA